LPVPIISERAFGGTQVNVCQSHRLLFHLGSLPSHTHSTGVHFHKYIATMGETISLRP